MIATKRPRLRPWPGRRFLGREDGQAAFEFLLMMPIFILFILMTVDFGIMMYEFVSVSNAAREGARFGAVNCQRYDTAGCTAALIQQQAMDRSGGIIASLGEVSVNWFDRDSPTDSNTNSRGDSVIVHVTHQYQFLFIPGITVPVTSCADMRIEQNEKGPTTSGSEC